MLFCFFRNVLCACMCVCEREHKCTCVHVYRILCHDVGFVFCLGRHFRTNVGANVSGRRRWRAEVDVRLVLHYFVLFLWLSYALKLLQFLLHFQLIAQLLWHRGTAIVMHRGSPFQSSEEAWAIYKCRSLGALALNMNLSG